MSGHRSKCAGRVGTRERGFSMVELLVAMALAAIMVAVIYSVFISYRKTVHYQEDIVEIQQAGRNAVAKIKNDVMMVGRSVKVNEGQEMVVHAGPWEIVFNGDMTSLWGQLPDDQTVIHGGADSPYDSRAWESDAETVRFYMSTQGSNVDEKDYSFAPCDRFIRRQVNNVDDSLVAFGVRYDNGATTGGCGYPVPAADPPQKHILPLFTYWGDFDFDPSTPDTLWGDANGNGRLSDEEIESLQNSSYLWSYQGPGGVINIQPIGGAVFLVGDANNNEDLDGDGILDPSEDVNRNGRLDRSVLDTAIHRIELNVTTIAQNPDLEYEHPRDLTYHFREANVHTAVEPRNLVRVQDRDCGGPPEPPTSVNASADECGGVIHVTWERSPDDGIGDNDVLWYEVQRRVGTGQWNYVALTPATGRALSGADYTYDDYDLQLDPPAAHTYRILAVDCGDSRSNASGNSGAVTPQSGAPGAPSLVKAFDTPCYNNAAYGSITIQWEASLDPNITEYWIYRSEANAINDVEPWPIAKVRVPIAGAPDPEDPNTTCGGGGAAFNSHINCLQAGAVYYKFGTTYAWRDQVGAPGRGHSVPPPTPGTQYLVGSTVTTHRYHYVIRGYDGTASSPTNECLSVSAHLESDCFDHMDVQSFDNSLTGAGGSTTRAMFTPPMDVQVTDASQIDWNGQFTNAAFYVQWYASLDQWCIPGSNKPGYYYVYRPLLYGLDLLHFATPGSEDENEFNFDDSGIGATEVIVYPAAQAVLTQVEYSWMDDNALYNVDNNHTPRSLDVSHNLAPNMGTTVGTYGKLFPGDIPSQPWPSPPPDYDYIVTAGRSSAPNGSPSSPWGFGASCSVNVGYECLSECLAKVKPLSAYCEQHSMHGDRETGRDGDDTIRVYWQFEQVNPETVGARIDLQARIFPSGAWATVDDELEDGAGGQNWAPNVTYVGNHDYADQAHGELYEYSLLIYCDPNDPNYGCKKRVLLGTQIGASVPGIPTWCFNTTDPACPTDAHAYCDDPNKGKVVFYIQDNLVSPANLRSQTEDQYLYFRVARYEKLPSAGSYPIEPASEYLLRPTFGSPSPNPSGMTCTGNYCYDTCPPFCPVRFDPFYGDFTEPDPTRHPRRFRYEDYLDPNLSHKFVVETRISHISNGAPRDCVINQYTCNGPNNDAIYVEFETDLPCYPYQYTGSPGFGPSYSGGSVTEYERDNFSGANTRIGLIDATHASSRIPWDNYVWPMGVWSFWIPFFSAWEYMYLGATSDFADDFYFRYSGGDIHTDNYEALNNWFWMFHWEFWGIDLWPQNGDIDPAMCNACVIDVWGIELFCATDFWPSCSSDLGLISNNSYLWSRYDAGHCGTTVGNYNIHGDFMMHWHWRSAQPNRRMRMAFRGRPSYFTNSVNTWFLEQNFENVPGLARNRYGVGYQRGTAEQAEYVLDYTVPNDSYDTQWWANFALVCQKRSGNDPTGLNQMFLIWWSEPDGNSKNMDFQTGNSTPNGGTFYSEPAKLAWHTIGATWAPGQPYYGSGGIAYETGQVGFWADPFINWEADNFEYDEVRIIPFCGACPPKQLEPHLPPPYLAAGDAVPPIRSAGYGSKSFTVNTGATIPDHPESEHHQRRRAAMTPDTIKKIRAIIRPAEVTEKDPEKGKFVKDKRLKQIPRSEEEED